MKNSRLASNLKVLRANIKVSQAKLATRFKISRERYAGWEEARAEPSIDMLIRISHFYNIPLEIILKKNL